MRKKMPLHFKIIIGLVLGIIWAFASSYLGWNEFTITWIDPFGTIFIRLLKLIAVPLVLFSIITGVASLTDVSKLGRLGIKTILFYLGTTILAVTVGLLCVNLISPGKHISEQQRMKNRISYEMWVENTPGVPVPKDGRYIMKEPQYADLVSQVVSEEEQQALSDRQVALDKQMANVQEAKEESPLAFLVDMVPENIITSIGDNQLMLQVIFFALFFGISLLFIPEDSKRPVLDFFNGINNVFLKMVDFTMQAAPFFVFALLAGIVAKMASTPAEVFEIFKSLGSYSITVVLGLAILLFGFYPTLITSIIRRLSYREFFRNLSPAQFLAFSTSSSAATLPVTIECVQDNMGVSKNISSFVLPIGATINMDGTSLYQAVAVVFLAQMHMIDLTLGQQLVIVFTATLASIGASATPSAGLVMMILVLESVGLNPAWIAIVFPVDRILDMCRTVINVTGDATACTLIAKTEGELTKY